MPTKCSVIGCSKESVARDLCSTHYKRQQRHGSVEQTRSSDWGKREAHPAYKAWCGLRRYHRGDMDVRWRDDFWAFAADVPEHPGGMAKAFRPEKGEPWSKENFFWREPIAGEDYRANRREYMRKYSAKVRAANPDYFRDRDLKRNYGVSLEWYRAKLEEQGGVCAICKRPELKKIKGAAVELAVDHCHTTGKARGLLCMNCNRALGFMDDDAKRLIAASEYLSKFP